MVNKTAFLVISILYVIGVCLFDQYRHSFVVGIHPEHPKVIGYVGDHELTQFDLEQKIKQVNANGSKDADGMALKLLVEETLLLQKAMAMKINENPDFLINIEHFWKQSLIQELFKRQMTTIEKQFALNEDLIHQHQILTQSQFLCVFLDSKGMDSDKANKLSKANISTMVAEANKPLNWVSYLDLPTDLRWKLLMHPKLQIIVSDSNSAVSDQQCFLWTETKLSEEGLPRDKSIELMKDDFIQNQLNQWVDQLHQSAEIQMYDAHLPD